MALSVGAVCSTATTGKQEEQHDENDHRTASTTSGNPLRFDPLVAENIFRDGRNLLIAFW